MSSRNLWIAIGVIVILLVGFIFVKNSAKTAVAPSTSEVTTPTESPTASASESASPSAAMSQNIVKITANGFVPQSITIKAGESVTWTNTDTAPHNVNSNPHPIHTDYPPLNLGTIQPGSSKSLTFPTKGTYGYHDHLNPQFKATVIVQ